MPSIADSKQFVRKSLNLDTAPDHDAILATLQDEIDKHNKIASDAEEHLRRRRERRERRNVDKASGSDLRFRFKDGTAARDQAPKRRRRRHRSPASEQKDEEVAHPFPREPAPSSAATDNDAFLSSLLDALADDEAAAYWESVYSQPIHAFSRPTVRTAKGELEEMDDEQYAAWVKEKMWEKQHPEVVLERDRLARKQEEESQQKRKRKEEFVRQRERDAWNRASAHKIEDYDYVFDLEDAQRRTQPVAAAADWERAWLDYLAAWAALNDLQSEESVALPRPALPSEPLTRRHIEAFMRRVPLQDGQNALHVLKIERIRWHPDKIQQRFHGKADEETIRKATSIFQIIDAIWTEEVSRRS